MVQSEALLVDRRCYFATIRSDCSQDFSCDPRGAGYARGLAALAVLAGQHVPESIARYMLGVGLTTYDVAVLLRAHPKAVAALLAV